MYLLFRNRSTGKILTVTCDFMDHDGRNYMVISTDGSRIFDARRWLLVHASTSKNNYT